ncbi:MAG: transcriptional regulator [Treponema sp.]|nr:transcriptional regulator [Treponema sp.]
MADLGISAKSEEDFSKVRNKALFNSIQHLLSPEETQLISLNDIKELLHPDNEVSVGMKTVPVENIIGSEGRYNDFDNLFFPKHSHLKNRWLNIDKAYMKGVILPAVTLYEIGGVYFVRDGNHRVSVAKARGVEFIDAEVTSLRTEIRLTPGKSMETIIKQIIAYEKRHFYAMTNYGDITGDWSLDFTTAGQYDVIYNHILTHKYYINQKQVEEISMTDAIMSWYNTVYMPVVNTVNQHRIMKKFKRRTVSDLYVWIVKYWDELKKALGEDFSLDQALEDFTHIYSETISAKIKNYLKKVWLKRSAFKKK